LYSIPLFILAGKNKIGTDWYVGGTDLANRWVVYPYSEAVEMISNRPGIFPTYRNNFSFPATDVMSAIVDLHHDIMFFLIVIIILVS